MLRGVSFALGIAAAVSLAGCGRQITPEPTTTDLAGKMVIRFTTAGPMDLSNFNYQIVFDTCGGGTPYPNVALTTYKDYSYSFYVGPGLYNFGPTGTAQPNLVQYILRTNNLNPHLVPLDPSTTQLTPNYGGSPNEFELIFARSQLENPLQITPVCPSTPANPDASGQSTTWKLNFFTSQAGNTPVLDSLGSGGPSDVTYNGLVIDTTQNSPNLVVKQTDISGPPSNQAAQIVGGEVDNYP